MEIHTAVPPDSAAPEPSDLAEQLAVNLNVAAGQRCDPLRARFSLVIDIDHLLQTGQTRRILSLGWRRE